MFTDRIDAGRQLGQALIGYRDEDPLVLGIPRGGVIIGIEIARILECDFEVLVTRKLPQPFNPEAGIGAIAEDGTVYYYPGVVEYFDPKTVEAILEEQKQVIRQRITDLREGRPLPEIEGRSVIIADDGIAMGSTMKASLMLCRNQGAGKVIIASPVAGWEQRKEFEQSADHTVILESPPYFHAVAQVYLHWHDVTTEEALEAIRRFRQERNKT